MGRIKDRLEHLLELEGFKCISIRSNNGYWRHMTADVYQWEGTGVVSERKDLPIGMGVVFESWDTMTSCARLGIELSPGDSGIPIDFMVSAKSVVRKTLKDKKPDSWITAGKRKS